MAEEDPMTIDSSTVKTLDAVAPNPCHALCRAGNAKLTPLRGLPRSDLVDRDLRRDASACPPSSAWRGGRRVAGQGLGAEQPPVQLADFDQHASAAAGRLARAQAPRCDGSPERSRAAARTIGRLGEGEKSLP